MNKIPWPKRDDETFTFLALEFNVTYAIEHIIKDREPTARVSPTIHHMSRIDTKHAMTTDTNNPVILANLGPMGKLCIDGNHRSYKAHVKGLDSLPAHVLTIEETLRCCITRPLLRKVLKGKVA